MNQGQCVAPRGSQSGGGICRLCRGGRKICATNYLHILNCSLVPQPSPSALQLLRQWLDFLDKRALIDTPLQQPSTSTILVVGDCH